MNSSRKIYLSTSSSIALLVTLLLTVAELARSTQLEDGKPFHLSWTQEETRFDFIFSLESPLKKEIELDNVNADYFRKSLDSCHGYSACLLRNGTSFKSYKLRTSDKDHHKSVFSSTEQSSPKSSECRVHLVHVNHYCSTHWTPPAHFSTGNCSYAIEWHSPYVCKNATKSYERPCYYYNTKGKLIDLTPLVWSHSQNRSDGIHAVSTDLFPEIKGFDIGVCNEASAACGPNIAACYRSKLGSIESGYLNSTGLSFNEKSSSLDLTYTGQYNDKCDGKRVKTTIKFVCKKNGDFTPGSVSKPALKSHTDCENIIEWQTVQACPLPEVQVPANECKIYHQPSGTNISLFHLPNFIESEEFQTGDGTHAKVVFGLCRGINKQVFKCEGKEVSSTSACFVPNSSTISPNQSQALGSVAKTFLRFADDALYLEYSNINKTCNFTVDSNLTVTRQLGARIEFYCDLDSTQSKPRFLRFDQCTYVFSWPAKWMCRRNLNDQSQIISKSEVKPVITANQSTTTVPKPKMSDEELKINLDTKAKSAGEAHEATLKEAKKLSESPRPKTPEIEPTPVITIDKPNQSIISGSKTKIVEPVATPNSVTPNRSVNLVDPSKISEAPQKMSGVQKVLMICLIVGSLAGFILVIFVLDSKTRLGLTLGRMRRSARRAFQPQPVPYSRVDEFNDSLDL